MDIKKVPYKKNNSFTDLSIKTGNNEHLMLIRIKEIFEKNKNKDFLKSNKKILDRISNHLFNKSNNEKNIFKLSPNVVKEIETIDDNKILNYLIHRFRYEIFPSTQEVDSFPPYLQIEPSSICNYRCVFCFQTDDTFNKRSQGHMGKMSLQLFKRIIDQAENNIEFISLASRGEPLLCPEIIPMLAYTRGKFLNLKMNTNAYELDEEKSHAILSSGLKTLVFSADAADKESYEKMRVYGKFERIMENIKRFKEIKQKHYSDSKIITRVSGVKIDDNQNINDMEKVWGDLVDQVAFVTYCAWTDTYNDEKNNIESPCSELWRRMYVWWDGKMNPCENDYKSYLKIGNFNENSIKEAWNSEFYKKLREDHISKKRNKHTPCDRCTVV